MNPENLGFLKTLEEIDQARNGLAEIRDTTADRDRIREIPDLISRIRGHLP